MCWWMIIIIVEKWNLQNNGGQSHHHDLMDDAIEYNYAIQQPTNNDDKVWSSFPIWNYVSTVIWYVVQQYFSIFGHASEESSVVFESSAAAWFAHGIHKSSLSVATARRMNYGSCSQWWMRKRSRKCSLAAAAVLLENLIRSGSLMRRFATAAAELLILLIILIACKDDDLWELKIYNERNWTDTWQSPVGAVLIFIII